MPSQTNIESLRQHTEGLHEEYKHIVSEEIDKLKEEKLPNKEEAQRQDIIEDAETVFGVSTSKTAVTISSATKDTGRDVAVKGTNAASNSTTKHNAVVAATAATAAGTATAAATAAIAATATAATTAAIDAATAATAADIAAAAASIATLGTNATI